MQLWWNSTDMTKPGEELRPCATKVVKADDVPIVVVNEGIRVRVLGGKYGNESDPQRLECPSGSFIAHFGRCECFVVTSYRSPTLMVLPARKRRGSKRLRGRTREGGERFLTLPSGGEIFALQGSDAAGQILIAVGMPHRKEYFKYVQYGGGLSMHRKSASSKRWKHTKRTEGVWTPGSTCPSCTRERSDIPPRSSRWIPR